MKEIVMASIEEVWGTKFASPTPLNKKAPAAREQQEPDGGKPVYSSPMERTQAAIYKNRKTIDDLSTSLPIVRSDEEGERNFNPTSSRIRDVAKPMREEMTSGGGYAYAPPGFQGQDQSIKLNRILEMIENNKSGYETGTTHDMILYVFTGVFFLFTLDTFVRLGKRMR